MIGQFKVLIERQPAQARALINSRQRKRQELARQQTAAHSIMSKRPLGRRFRRQPTRL